jgi:hypothetical protein
MNYADCNRCRKHGKTTGKQKCPFPDVKGETDFCTAFVRVKEDLTTEELCRRIEKLQGTLFKLIANLEHIKLELRGE